VVCAMDGMGSVGALSRVVRTKKKERKARRSPGAPFIDARSATTEEAHLNLPSTAARTGPEEGHSVPLAHDTRSSQWHRARQRDQERSTRSVAAYHGAVTPALSAYRDASTPASLHVSVVAPLDVVRRKAPRMVAPPPTPPTKSPASHNSEWEDDPEETDNMAKPANGDVTDLAEEEGDTADLAEEDGEYLYGRMDLADDGAVYGGAADGGLAVDGFRDGWPGTSSREGGFPAVKKETKRKAVAPATHATLATRDDGGPAHRPLAWPSDDPAAAPLNKPPPAAAAALAATAALTEVAPPAAASARAAAAVVTKLVPAAAAAAAVAAHATAVAATEAASILAAAGEAAAVAAALEEPEAMVAVDPAAGAAAVTTAAVEEPARGVACGGCGGECCSGA